MKQKPSERIDQIKLDNHPCEFPRNCQHVGAQSNAIIQYLDEQAEQHDHIQDAPKMVAEGPIEKVNRFEVIDHTSGGEGRVFTKWLDNLVVELSYQDDGRTLKVFLSEKDTETGKE